MYRTIIMSEYLKQLNKTYMDSIFTDKLKIKVPSFNELKYLNSNRY